MIRFDIPYVEKDGSLTQAGYTVFAAQDRQILASEGAIAVLEAADATEAANAPGSAPRYSCRAWVNFNGTGTVAIRASGNVSSITDNGTGDYTVNFTTAMPDANYAVCAMMGIGSNGGAVRLRDGFTPTTSQVWVQTLNNTGGALVDPNFVHVAVFR